MAGSVCGLQGSFGKGSGLGPSWTADPAKLPSSSLDAAIPRWLPNARRSPCSLALLKLFPSCFPWEGCYELAPWWEEGAGPGVWTEEQVLESHQLCVLRPAAGAVLGPQGCLRPWAAPVALHHHGLFLLAAGQGGGASHYS